MSPGETPAVIVTERVAEKIPHGCLKSIPQKTSKRKKNRQTKNPRYFASLAPSRFKII